MMNKRLKQGTTFLLALALAFPLLTLPGARAANAIETNRKCSVAFNVSGEDNELTADGTDIIVNLYKVADVDVSGNYTATKDFTGLNVSSVSADDKDAAASEWADRAKEAQKMLKESVEPTATVTLAAGTGSLADLATGLYLVDTPEVVTTNYTYTFTPYLVSLPTNNYYSNGNDDWIYDLTKEYNSAVGLKPEEHARYGDLKINKTLAHHNATTGKKATFVFKIEITPLKGKTETLIESLDFEAAGDSSVTITKIPAGATVKVTEVYSGASYKLISENDQETTIVATDKDAKGDPASVSFTNDVDDNMNGGYGVKNNFKLDENGQYQYTEPAEKN